MLALQYRKSVPRYVWVKLVGGRFPGALTAPGGFLHLTQVPEPSLPTASWVRIRPSLSGICGSDLGAVAGKSSIYLSAFTSFPFVPGHEVVASVVETGPAVSSVSVGERVVLEPALGCTARGFSDLCHPCRDGHYANCERVTQGDVSAGVQTGYCRDTGGGWGSELVAHESQLHVVPGSVPDEAAVMTEPLSCAMHSVLEAQLPEGARVLVVGSGTIGLLTVAALEALAPTATVVAVAKYAHQKELATALGAGEGEADLKSPVAQALLPIVMREACLPLPPSFGEGAIKAQGDENQSGACEDVEMVEARQRLGNDAARGAQELRGVLVLSPADAAGEAADSARRAASAGVARALSENPHRRRRTPPDTVPAARS